MAGYDGWNLMFRPILPALLAGAVLCVAAQKPVYVALWFDTEDYIEPAADDAALRIASDLTNLGVRATFKVVGEKARTLERRGRTDVIRALSRHAIGYHSNFHSVQPAPAVYLRRFGFVEGAAEFERQERSGIEDLRRIFGTDPVCYGQPGSSWAPQTGPALRRLGIPVYLDAGTHVGVEDQPIWYEGLLYIYSMGRYQIRPDLDHGQTMAETLGRFDALAKELAGSGGVISTYFHPTEFVTTEFWDAVNFSHGATRERADWVRPHRRTPEESDRCYRILREYVEHALKTPGVQFVTARDLLQLYSPQASPAIDPRRAAERLAKGITFSNGEAGTFSAADLLLAMLGGPWEAVDGPATGGSTRYTAETIPKPMFDGVVRDAVSFIRTNHRLPAEVFVGAETMSLADFTATLARQTLRPADAVRVARGSVEFERYFSTDPVGAFDWPIHPAGFSAPELLELARLQGWTLKPARLR